MISSKALRDLAARPPAALRGPVARLAGITGFATTLHSSDDRRPQAFARVHHVGRVAEIAVWLLEQRLSAGATLDPDRVWWMAWAHDLNRWPFAHNSEKALGFDQALNLPAFFEAAGIVTTPELTQDLAGVVSKELDGLSAEGRIVLLADMVAGFLEDPLMAVAALDIDPGLIPTDIQQILGLPVNDDAWLSSLYDLGDDLRRSRDPAPFTAGLNALHRERALAFLRLHGYERTDPLGSSEFEAIRSAVKDHFLRPVIFPYNNDKVSHGALLRARVIEPLVLLLGGPQSISLTRLTEAAAVDVVVRHGDLAIGALASLQPDIDYVRRVEPMLSFSRRWESLRHA